MSKIMRSGWTLRPPFRAEGANGWIVRLSSDLHGLTDSNETPRRSPLRLHENGREIGTPHANHEGIRRHGCGRYSFWSDSLYFSTLDGSDPNTNGRSYEAIASPDGDKPSPQSETPALSGDANAPFDLGRLPFVCNDFPLLAFRKSRISWEEILPDLPERRRLLGEIERIGTFSSPGRFGADISSMTVDSAGIGFAQPGTYNVLTNYGAFKFLILSPERSLSDLIAIGRFVANNTLHSGFDVSSCTYGRFTSSLINYQNLHHKLFFSDQPLGLLCCSAAFCLCALCEILGYEARRVHLTGPGRGGHFSVEVHDGTRWFVMDPDLDFIARDDSGDLVDAEALLRGNVVVESLSSKQLTRDNLEGDWLASAALRAHVERSSGQRIDDWWNLRYGFSGGYTWRSAPGYGVGYADIAMPFLRGLETARRMPHSRSHPLIASETWEKYLPDGMRRLPSV